MSTDIRGLLLLRRCNYRWGENIFSHYSNSHWQQNNNNVVASQTTGKHECGNSPYFCLWKSLFVLSMSHSSPSVAQRMPWPNLVGFFLEDKPKIIVFIPINRIYTLRHMCTNGFSQGSSEVVVVDLWEWQFHIWAAKDTTDQQEVSTAWENDIVNRKHGRKNTKCILPFQLRSQHGRFYFWEGTRKTLTAEKCWFYERLFVQSNNDFYWILYIHLIFE